MTTNVNGLVFFRHGFFVKELVVTCQTKHWVFFRRAMDPVGANLYNVMTLNKRNKFDKK